MLAWRRAGIAVVVLMLALCLGAAATTAKKKHRRPKGQKWASQVTLAHPASIQFSGTVSSKLSACRDARLVTLYYTDPATLQTQPLSVQRTDKSGNYLVSLTAPAYAGTYQVQVSGQKIRAMKAPQTCNGAQSSTVTV